jgi:hypothetical protein
MPWFRCFIRGENFPGQLIGESDPIGFYVSRFAEAENAEAAEMAALCALKAESSLVPPPGYASKGKAMVFFQEIEELPAAEVPAVRPGFVFYPMDESADGPI